LPERVFVQKLKRAGFADIQTLDERVFGIDDLTRYPLFTPSLIANMRRLLTPERQDAVARSVVFNATKPAAAPGG
jgi:hypothetical protein